VYAALILFILVTPGSDKSSLVGLAGVLLGATYFLFGIISMISKDTRNAGIAFLISSGIIFLIGLSVCSMNPVKI
jgi:hypothetical protein